MTLGKKDRKKRRAARAEARTPNDFIVELLHLEIASGYDGLFRGAPEPALVIGAYALGPTPRTLMRTVFRIDVFEGKFPQTVPVFHDEHRARVGTGDADDRVLLVVVGIEDDGGASVSKIYGALERASELSLASLDRGDDVSTLVELSTSNGWREATRAMIVVDGVPMQALCGEDDDWVGAAAVVVTRASGAQKHRMHIAAGDLLNDWTALFTTNIGWRR